MKLWYEKYRPKTLDEYVWSEGDTKRKVAQWLADHTQFPHLVLTGPSGTGKTTLAGVLRRELGIEDEDFLFIAASRMNGIDDIRGRVCDFCETSGWGELKMVVFDEAERLSRDAQEMLRNVIDTYNDHVRFVFTCNEARRIIDPLKGRCRVMQIEALDEEEFINRLVTICESEGVELDDDGITIIGDIVGRYYPNMRKSIDMLQDSFSDGRLVRFEETQVSAADWEDAVRSVFHGGNIGTLREVVMGVDRGEIERVYQFMYERSVEFFGDNEAEAIVLIAKYLHTNMSSPFPEITLCACLVELTELGTGGG